MAKKNVADDAKFSTGMVSGAGKIKNVPVIPDLKSGDAFPASVTSVAKKKYSGQNIEDEMQGDEEIILAAAEQAVSDSVVAASEQPILLAQADASLSPGSDPVKPEKTTSSSGSTSGWWWLGGVGLAAAGTGLGVSLANNDSASPGPGPNPNKVAMSGNVTDGPVEGADIYVDSNSDGKWDAGDKVLTHNGQQITTDADGNFEITEGDLIENNINLATVKLVSHGGTDTVSGEAVTIDFTAPAGYLNLNPVTSVIAAYMETHGVTAADAEAAVETALGLPDLDYSTANLADPEIALQAQQAAAILATAAIIMEQAGNTDAFQYLADNIGNGTSTAEMVATVSSNVSDTAAAQLAATVTLVLAAENLEAINDAIVLTVNNTAPVFTSSAIAGVAENTTSLFTVAASDADSNAVTYSITGGADQASFSINSTTGALSFISAPDFENPVDTDHNNSYVVQVSVNDGHGGITAQAITANVTNVNDNSPVFTSSANVSVAENSTAVITVAATDADQDTVTYSLTGGVDQALFAINPSTGVLTFLYNPNYEVPCDSDSNNVYDVQVTVADTAGLTDVQNLAVTITDVNEAPVISSNGGGASAAVSAVENQTAVTTVTSSDVDAGDGKTFSITGGADQALFAINSATGALTFLSAPNFETPADAGANNVYDVQITVTDTAGLTDVQDLAVSVTGLNDNDPVFTSAATAAVAENSTVVLTAVATDADLPGQTVTYSITGGADQGKFAIDATTGALSFIIPPDFENPTDADTFNDYVVQVTADDGNGGTIAQTITATVTDVVDITPPLLLGSLYEDVSGTGTLDSGDKLHLTFDEAVNIDTTGIYMAAFGSGAMLAAVAPDGNGFSTQWDLTFGSDMAIAPNAINLSGAVSDAEGNVNNNLAIPFHSPVQVVVDASGAYIDANQDGLKDAGDTVAADFDFGGNADLGHLAVQVAFTDVPTTQLDLTGFNQDDRIIINIDSLNMPKPEIATPLNSYNTNIFSSDITSMFVSATPINTLYAFVADSMPQALQLFGRNTYTDSGFYLSSYQTLANFGSADLMANSRFIHQVAFVENTGHVNVVVDAIGDAYIDANDDGLLDAGDTVLADLGFFGNESLASHSVDITFTAPVANPLDLGGFGADDRIHINLDSPGFAGFAGVGAQGISDVSYSSSSSRMNMSGNSAQLIVSMSSTSGYGYIYLYGRSRVGAISQWTSNVTLANINSSLIDRMGGIIHHVDFVGNVSLVPHELGAPATPDLRVVVDANGAWIVDNNDGRVNDSNVAAVFTAAGNADLSTNAVDITVNGFPGTLDFSGFNADDRIHINLNGSGIRAMMSSASVTTVDAGNIKLWVSASSQRSGLTAPHQSVSSWDTTQGVYVYAGPSRLRVGAWGGWSSSSQTLATFSTVNPIADGSGNLMQQVDFVLLPIPQQNVVVESGGAWLDANADGVHDSANETTAADFSPGGNAGLGAYAVTIHYNDRPGEAINLAGFGADDRIVIDVAAMRNGTSSDSIALSLQSLMSKTTPSVTNGPGVRAGSSAVFLSSSSLIFGHTASNTTTITYRYFTDVFSSEGLIAINAGGFNFNQVDFVQLAIT